MQLLQQSINSVHEHFCHICQVSDKSEEFLAHEKMFGMSGEFLYFKCPSCGCVQQAEMCHDLSRYYPEDYYSFGSHGGEIGSGLKHSLHRRRGAHTLGRPSWLGWVLCKIYGPPAIPDWLKQTGVNLNDSLLDVGTGNGELLFQLSRLGFTRLTGLDPYVGHDAEFRRLGVRICKSEIQGHEGNYDLVMFHHSFEHMQNPRAAIKEAARLVKPGRYVLIRIPVAGTYAWRNYGLNWVQFDAPRHIFLHTVKSMEILAESAGLVMEKVIFDSTSFQFWGSEQNLRGIPLFSGKSYVNSKTLFSEKEIDIFEQSAIKLNHMLDGDQACFYLKRPVDNR